VQLINRTTRRLEMTEAGRTFHEYCRQVEATWQEAEAAVGEIRREPRGTLRLNAPVMIGQILLPRIISGFLAEYPDVQIMLDLSDHYVDVIEGGYDVVIRVGKLKDSSLRARQIGTIRLHLYAHASYLDRRGTPQRPGELAGHNCLVYRYKTGDPYVWEFSGPEGPETVEIHGNFTANNGAPLYQAAMGGLGIARLPGIYEQAYGMNGMRYVLEDYAVDSAIHAVYAATRRPPLNTRYFIDYLAEHFTAV
jgi:DNA-binding transcriptional LysR family regulator